jgi:phospholipid/cholesterol/gamma-HCH transport system substrate-binding protein
MHRNIVETITGAFVILAALWFVVFFINKTNAVSITQGSHTINAKFDDIDTVAIGAPVKIGGVKIGVVSSIQLDPKTYMAMLSFAINQNITLPVDSSAKIASSGLLGDKYVTITPGADEVLIPSGGEIKYTESAVNLENLIGKVIYNSRPSSPKEHTEQDTNGSSIAPSAK